MGNTLFATQNENVFAPVYHGGITAVSILNGVGLHAPALEQDAAFPMANLLNMDRYLPWMTSAAPPSATKIDIDLGASRSVRYLALHGIRCAIVQEFLFPRPFLFYAQYQVSSYDGTGTWLNFAGGTPSAFGGYRDAVFDNGSAVSFRYVRFYSSDATSAPFAIGHLFGGVADVDVGFVYSPNSQRNFNRRFIRVDGFSTLSATEIGDPSTDFVLRFDDVSNALRDLLTSVVATRKPVTYITHDGFAFQVVPKNVQFVRTHTFAPPDLWSAELQLMGLY